MTAQGSELSGLPIAHCVRQLRAASVTSGGGELTSLVSKGRAAR